MLQSWRDVRASSVDEGSKRQTGFSSHVGVAGPDGNLDMTSVAEILAAMLVISPQARSRVILLSVHTQDAWRILKHAA